MTDLKYKLLALDVDGTLVTDTLVITDPVKKAIAAAQERGVVPYPPVFERLVD